MIPPDPHHRRPHRRRTAAPRRRRAAGPEGATMLAKRQWAMKHLDHLRRALMLEPRGHADMYGALLTEPVTPGAHAGVLFMHNEGWSTMCGHGVIAVSTIAVERGLMWDAAAARTRRRRDRPRCAGRPGARRGPADDQRGPHARPPGLVPQRAVVRARRRACRCRWPAAPSPPTWLLAARSTRSSTPRRPGCRWTPPSSPT